MTKHLKSCLSSSVGKMLLTKNEFPLGTVNKTDNSGEDWPKFLTLERMVALGRKFTKHCSKSHVCLRHCVGRKIRRCSQAAPATANWTNPIIPSSSCEKNGFRSARKSPHGPVKKDKDINQLILESEAHLSFQTLHHL